jgi:hypothetical protein
LLADAGFGLEHAVLIPEPCGVFNIVAVPETRGRTEEIDL